MCSWSDPNAVLAQIVAGLHATIHAPSADATFRHVIRSDRRAVPGPETNGRGPTSVEVIALDEAFAALAVQWSGLAKTDTPFGVFLSHEWFSAAWAWRRLDSDLMVLAVRDGDLLIGLLPLVRSRSGKSLGRRLGWLAVPDTQVCDLLAVDGRQAEAADAIAHALANRRDWNTLHLDYLDPSGSTVALLLPRLARGGLAVCVREGGRNPYVELGGGWKAFYDTRSRSLKKANNLAANRLKKAGDVSIHLEGTAEAGSAQSAQWRDAVDTTIEVSARSWKQSTGNSLDQPGPQAFIRTLSESAAARGWLSIWLLRLNGKPMAAEYQLVAGGNVHALRADFDAECVELSPGSHLFRTLLESLFDKGLSRYYMGPGENPYKLRWTDLGKPVSQAVVYNRTIGGRIAWLRDEFAIPLARRLRSRLSKGDRGKSHASPDRADPED